jgi:hypothetical protein
MAVPRSNGPMSPGIRSLAVLCCRLVARIVTRCAWRRGSKQLARLNIKVSPVGLAVEQNGMELFEQMKLPS